MFQCAGFYIGLLNLFGHDNPEAFSEYSLLTCLSADVLFSHTGLASIQYTKIEGFDSLGYALSSHEPSFYLNSNFHTLPIDVVLDSELAVDGVLRITINPSNSNADDRVFLSKSVGYLKIELSCLEKDEDLFFTVLTNIASEWSSHIGRYREAQTKLTKIDPDVEAILTKSLNHQINFNQSLSYGHHLASEFQSKNNYIQILLDENASLLDQRSAGNRIIDYTARKIRGLRDLRFQKQGINQPVVTAVSDESAKQVMDINAIKKQQVDRANKRLEEFLDNNERLTIGNVDRPIDVSVVLITWGRAELTLQCLESLALITSPNIEVIILDNDSPDNTLDMLSRLDGNVQVIKNTNNDGFVLGVNMATKYVTSDVILLLNNDTTVPADSIRNALDRLMSDESIGAVGAKIILPDGLLQEAGSFVWNHGGAQGYLRGADIDDPHGDFARPVDFVSGAFLMTRRSDWEEIGGFDEQFAPAYFEEVDFCLTLPRIGKHVIYDPSVTLNHFEYASSKKRDDAIKLQKINRSKLRDKHSDYLNISRFKAHEDNIELSRSVILKKRNGMDLIQKNILFIDDLFPDPAIGSGFGRSHDMLSILSENVRHVSLIPLNFPNDRPSNWREFWDNRVEVLFGIGRAHFVEYLGKWHDYFDHIMVSRPHNIEFVKSTVPAELLEDIEHKLIYDAEAIFTFRENMQAAVNNKPWTESVFQSRLSRELNLAKNIKNITVVSKNEANYFQEAHPEANIKVLMHACPEQATKQKFSERSDVLFVGNLSAPVSPNVDGVKELCRLWAASKGLKGMKLNIVGSLGDTGWHKKYESKNINFLGRVDDLTKLYETSKVFVAPARFAAGIPIKVLEAMSYGLPCVISDILGEQLSVNNNDIAITTPLTPEMISAIKDVHGDYKIWSSLRKKALNYIQTETSETQFKDNLLSLFSET